MKRIIFTAIVALMVTFAFAETKESKSNPVSEAKTEQVANVDLTSLSGNIIDKVSGEALVGVEVKLEGTGIKTYTDFDGNFTFKNISTGTCKLITSYTSYDKNEKSLKITSENKDLKIELQASK